MKPGPARHVAQTLQAGWLRERVQVRQQRGLIKDVVVTCKEQKIWKNCNNLVKLLTRF